MGHGDTTGQKPVEKKPRVSAFSSDEVATQIEAKVTAYEGLDPMLAVQRAPTWTPISDPFTPLYEGRAESPETAEAWKKDMVGAHYVQVARRNATIDRIRKADDPEEAEKQLNQAAYEEASQQAQARPDAQAVAPETVGVRALEIEDDLAGVVDAITRNMIVEPPFSAAILEELVYSNNALLPAVQAMEVNIDGTGWELVPTEEVLRGLLKPAVEGEVDENGEPVEPPKFGATEETEETEEEEPLEGEEATAGGQAPRPGAKPTSPVAKPLTKKLTKALFGEDEEGEAAEEDDEDEPGTEGEIPGMEGPDPIAMAAEAEIDRKKAELEGFFKEPWPGESFTTQRRKLRHDLESTGNAWLEVVRNAADEIVLTKVIDAKTMRIIRLDNPVPVEMKLERFGETLTVNMLRRERRFVQWVGSGAISPRTQQAPVGEGFRVQGPPGTGTKYSPSLFSTQGTRLIYFKEFGASRDVDVWTGGWSLPGARIPIDRRGTEVIHFTLVKDPGTPYGLPRWINQLPSVLGSRRAEEFNLQFFNAGGVPPLLITVSGGQLAPAAKQALERQFTSQGKARHQAVVFEVAGSGRVDGRNDVKIGVERFGTERMQDSMFEKYDERCEIRIRSSFRLSEMFVGRTKDFNFATAQTSYLVNEAQVFAPERHEFDEIVNLNLLRAMPNGEMFEFRSKPLVIKDATMQNQAIQFASGSGLISGKETIDALNEITHLDLEFDEAGHKLKLQQEQEDKQFQREQSIAQAEAGGFGQPIEQGKLTPETGKGVPPKNGKTPAKAGGKVLPFGKKPAPKQAVKIEKIEGLITLAEDMKTCLSRGVSSASRAREFQHNKKLFDNLSKQEKETVLRKMGELGFVNSTKHDFEGLLSLIDVSADLYARHADRH